MKQKKLYSFLAVMLLVSFLTACSGGQTSPDNSALPTLTDQASVYKGPDAGNVNPKGVFPIVKNPIKLTVAMPVNVKVEDINTNKFTNFLEKTSGMELEFINLPSQDVMTKINLMFASNDLPDVFTGVGFSYINLIDKSEQGSIIPLNDLIKVYGDNIFKVYKESQNRYVERLLTLPDGKIYATPAIVEATSNTYNDRAWVYEPWLKKLGIKMPANLDELYQLLKAFKEKDPNGNGKADEIPMAGYKATNLISYIGNAFQYTDQSDKFQLADGKVSVAFTKPEYKDTLAYLNKLCKEGLLDPVTFTQENQQWKTMVAQNTPMIGVLPHPQKSGAIDVTSERGREYIIIPPLAGPKGFKTTIEILPGVSYSYVITSKCKNPAAAYRLADFMLGRESSMYGRYGEKGVEWADPEPGAIGNNGEPALFRIINNVWGLPNSNAIWYNDTRSAFLNVHDRLSSKGDPYEYDYQIMQSAIKDYKPAAAKEYLPPLLMDAKQSARFDELRTAINTYVNENSVRFIVGDRSFETWDAYLAEFNKLNLQEYIKLAQEAYENFKK